MSPNTCPDCEKPMRMRAYRHAENVGGLHVVDGTTQQLQCDACGAVDLPLEALHSFELRAACTAFHDGKERVTGPALKYARKAIGLTQKQLATLLDCGHETVSRYETSSKALPTEIRLAVLSLITMAERGTSAEQLLHEAGQPAPSTLEVVELHRTG
jgi:DNA-binding transcriptional regulator YiaG